MTIDNNQLVRLTDDLTNMINDLDSYIKKNKQRQRSINKKEHELINNNNNNHHSQCHYIKSKDGKDRIMCVHVTGAEHNPIHRGLIKKYNKNNKNNKNINSIKSRLADKPIHKKIINGKVMAPWGDKWLPVCDGSGFPYVQGCYSDASNWSSGPKQCIIENPATPNLANGSLYTCGFLW